MPSLFILSRFSFGESVSFRMTTYDCVPFGPFDHEMAGLILVLGPAWPSAAGMQKVYLAGIILPVLTGVDL